MKLEKGSITATVFIGSLVILLAAAYIFSGFRPGTQTLIAVVYFAIWITLLTFLWFSIISPAIADKLKQKKTVTEKQPQQDIVKPSPRAHLPLRERIQQYVAERRREDGLPAPEPLRPSRTTGTPVTTAGRAAVTAGSGGASIAAAPSGEGELPLPDDFDSGLGEGDELPGLDEEPGAAGELPPLPDDFDSGLGEGEGLPGLDEEPGATEELPPLPDLDGDISFDVAGPDEEALPGELPDDLSGDLSGDFSGGEVSEPADNGGGSLPDFDGDLDADMSESDLSGDDDFNDFPTDLSDEEMSAEPSPDEEIDEMPPEPAGEDDGGGLPDFDGDLDADMSESDLSGDDDLGDIEFEDLEPDEI